MFLRIKKVTKLYIRNSKLGKEHTYSRTKSIAIFRCDSCDNLFERDQGNIDYRRLSNTYFHVCSNCNQKKFAQQKAVERKHIWDMPIDSDIDISKI